MTHRDSTLDSAKGLAIVAIVFGHSWRGLNSAGLIPDPALFNAVDAAVYIWHLSVFAFTAGLFVERGMRRDGPWHYALQRDLGFLWLYVLWSLIQGAVKLAAGGSVNSQTSVADILALWRPEGQLWFFGWIGLMMLLAAATQPWTSPTRRWVTWGSCVILTLVTWGWGGPYLGTQGLALTGFFVTGMLVGGERLLRLLHQHARSLALSLGTGAAALASSIYLAVSTGAMLPTVPTADRTVAGIALGVLASTAGLVGVLLLARAWSLLGGKVFDTLGRQSLVIFVAHIVFASGMRVVLTRLGVTDPPPHVLIGTLAGVVGPLFLHWVAGRLHATWLFDAPTWLTRLVPSRPA